MNNHPHPKNLGRGRLSLIVSLVLAALACLAVVWHTRAANPTSGTISPSSAALTWDGTAAGGVSLDESTCQETGTEINCDTFTITVSGTPEDWAGKQIEVAITWVVLASDYDLYIHKGSNAGPEVARSAGSMTTSETAYIEPLDLNPNPGGTTVFTAHVVYFAATAGDQYHGAARAVSSGGGATPTPTPPPKSTDWKINYHGTCCEGNLAAAGNNTYVLLPVLLTGNKIKRSTNGGQTWEQTYPPVGASVPYGIEGDMQAFKDGNTDHAIFFGTELIDAVVAKSTDGGATWSNFPVPLASGGNDQAWAYLGPLSGMRQPVPLQGDASFVLAGWMRIGTALAFSFDGGQTWTNQTTLVGNNGSGPEHVACHTSAANPPIPAPPDIRTPHPLFANQKAGRHGAWGTDRKFYWTETVENVLYFCQTDDFLPNPDPAVPLSWTGNKHPVSPGPGSGFVVTHTAFDNRGTLYVLHGNKLYVSFNGGKTISYIHTLPRYGNAGRSDAGADQYFTVNCGTIHVGLLEDAGEGKGRVYYLRGKGVDTAQPTWDQELVDEVDNVRLDFMYIVLDGNDIPTISYTTPTQQVTTASRNAPMPGGQDPCVTGPLRVVSRKPHGTAGPFDIHLPLTGNRGIECRRDVTDSDHYTLVFTFGSDLPAVAPVDSVNVTGQKGTPSIRSSARGPLNNQFTVELQGILDTQTISVTLNGVHAAGGEIPTAQVSMGVLYGDVNGDATPAGLVSNADVGSVKAQVSSGVTEINFRNDVNANGTMSNGDVGDTKAQVGQRLP